MSEPEHAAAAEMARELLAGGERICFVARGASMRPFLRDGDRLTVSPDLGGLRVGDLVLLGQGELGPVHRVVARLGPWFCVKGDATASVDGWFRTDDILGRVVRVERGGRAVPPGRWSAVALNLVGGLARRLLPRVRLDRRDRR